MKTQDEIQKAHDCLVAFVLGEAPILVKNQNQASQ
jgi:hypothetical protein